MRLMKVGGILGVPLSALLLAFVLGVSVNATTANPLEKINIWEGHWKVQVQTKETAYGHASSQKGNMACSWSPDHAYMVCEYVGDFADPHKRIESDHLSIFTYNATAKAYKHLGVSTDFKTLEEPAIIRGNVWTTPYERPYHGKRLRCRDVYEFVTLSKQKHRFEVSADSGRTWTVVSEAVWTKTA